MVARWLVGSDAGYADSAGPLHRFQRGIGRRRHAIEESGSGSLRRVEIAVSIEPDYAGCLRIEGADCAEGRGSAISAQNENASFAGDRIANYRDREVLQRHQRLPLGM